MICKKANAGIGAMRRIKPFARDTPEKVYIKEPATALL